MIRNSSAAHAVARIHAAPSTSSQQICQIPLPSTAPLQIPALLRNLSFSHSRSHKRAPGSCVLATNAAAASAGVFPGGTRRASVRLPGLGLRLKAEDILEDGEEKKAVLDSAVAAGLNLVILEDGKEDSLRFYDAARIVMSIVRGRADVLIVERVDIAAAAGSNGVVLSDQGLPSVVARRMMQNAMPEAVVLPLVARRVTSYQSAEIATITEGADFLLLQCEQASSASAKALVEGICKRVKIPVFLEWARQEEDAVKLLKVGAGGIILDSLPAAAEVSSFVTDLASKVASSVYTKSGKGLSLNGEGAKSSSTAAAAVLSSIEQQAKLLIEEERPILTSAVEIIKEASPQMEEVGLLVDAVKQLEELFLLVVVGEFNSGKSSVINALLGDRFLKQGVLPTTNEITLLKYSDESYEERPARHPDGHLMRYLSAGLLKQMNLVDTPGTNVILQRQQRLTEEFVPRADLVLFVIGAERPLTESEVSFLRYIRRWNKKIIFTLNKCDLLSEESEVEEVRRFVADNVRQLLNIEAAMIFPISARKALHAKVKAKQLESKNLERDPLWTASGFDKLEQYVLDFLGGSSDAGAERIRLKLETPIGIAAALLSAARKQVEADAANNEVDQKVLDEMEDQFTSYKQLLGTNVDLQVQLVITAVAEATARALKFVDKRLQVTSVDTASKYLLPRNETSSAGAATFEREIIGTALSDVKNAIEDHKLWVTLNTQRQLEKYVEIGKSRWPDTEVVTDSWSENVSFSGRSLTALDEFDVKAANLLLEQELREAVFSTFESLGIAGASASLLTSVLPTTLEDLIALGLCSAGGLVSIFKLSSLREEIKRKVEQVAQSLSLKLEEEMKAELQESIQSIESSVLQFTAPYRSLVEKESTRIAAVQEKLVVIDKELQMLRKNIQNLGS
ncbi:probable transmembrane GTPase FZO-like, chloroplastic [Selaginella moellendorffii]|uniref:probable transmembrane GTPase FZO-like, chloroplastic n=1 Tax=Selaginella moellendorffii TaxID=88036 RepID=UPI000D1C469C|nr:probable transmembrane GTPase FZO-like, chloroplastic [Selaginella moellendorffii]|eukprot:XP_024533529.1 probable transmembrane GTPase FZO-like, chloroplastic [Selaginella moellendorffii]